MSNPDDSRSNVDAEVVADFGREWQAFDQQKLVGDQLLSAFDDYFHIFPFDRLAPGAIGFDMGCGSGRWAKLMAPRVGRLRCIDPSALALEQARRNLIAQPNCEFECAAVSDTDLPPGSQDFGYCLGVLHHIPDTKAGLASCVSKLKPGAPFLVYLYYRFDNRPSWFKTLWIASDWLRRGICRLPFPIKLLVSQLIAAVVYWPLARLARLCERFGADVSNFPLAYYRTRPFYSLRTDALDRFGTKLERRFTRAEIQAMMEECGLESVGFSERTPHWVAVGFKAALRDVKRS
jgi:SAM-dependent methyltransferase